MGSENKIILWEQLEAWREEVRARGQKLVVTNGCFDILHTGHVVYLENARTEADLLLVGVDSDASVRSLKGPSRPVNGQEDRARLGPPWRRSALSVSLKGLERWGSSEE